MRAVKRLWVLIWKPYNQWYSVIMKKCLSTQLTFFFKFVYSTMWFPICGFMVVSIATDMAAKPESGLHQLVVFLVIVPFYAFWRYSKIKVVQVDEQYLYISNYLTKDRITIQNVARVRRSLGLQDRLTVIELQRTSRFGSRIVFMPPPMFLFWRRHPIEEELKGLVNSAKSSGS